MPYTKTSWDWKAGPSLADLRAALEPLGVFVYEDPSLEGSDSYGYIFSNSPLTDEMLNVIGDEEYE